jgi:hypothetical protein
MVAGGLAASVSHGLIGRFCVPLLVGIAGMKEFAV